MNDERRNTAQATIANTHEGSLPLFPKNATNLVDANDADRSLPCHARKEKFLLPTRCPFLILLRHELCARARSIGLRQLYTGTLRRRRRSIATTAARGRRISA